MAHKPLEKESTIDQAALFWGVDREVVWSWFRDELIRAHRERGRLVLPKGAEPPKDRPPLRDRFLAFFHRLIREEK